MKLQKTLMIGLTLVVASSISCKNISAETSLHTSVPVDGTLYSISEPNPLPSSSQPSNLKDIKPIKSQTSGSFGKLGDSKSDVMVLAGIMLILFALGLTIERRL